MHKHLLVAAGVTLCLVACASTPPGTTRAKSAAATRLPAGCVDGTASRFPVGPNECAGFGSVHVNDRIRNTGTADVGRALNMLDPAISVGH